MPSDVAYDDKLRLIEVVHTGFVSEENLGKCTADGIAIHLEKGVNEVLISALELESFADFLDVHERPRHCEEANVSRSTRFAVVSPRSAKAQEFIQFYDNICFNRGWKVKQSKSRDEVIT